MAERQFGEVGKVLDLEFAPVSFSPSVSPGKLLILSVSQFLLSKIAAEKT